MDNTKEYIRHLSLCSGYEGIGLGLRRVLPDVREVAHVEIEAFAVSNLVAKMEEGKIHPAPVFTNLKEFPFRKFRGCVDILSGGFPCQPFSSSGSRKSTEDPRHLFPYILEGIKECQPSVIFLENVEGIISAKTGDGGSVLKYVLQSLEEVGYRATAGVFSASEIGASHQRKRVFIMAHRKDFRCGRGAYRDGANGQGLQEQEKEKQPMVRGEAAGCGGDIRELGNAKHDGCVTSEVRGSFKKTGEDNSQGKDTTSESTGAGRPQIGGDIQGGELANTDSSRGREDREQPELWAVGLEQPSEGAWLRSGEGAFTQGQEGTAQSWPSRPNEEQYDWEEPRVVEYTKGIKRNAPRLSVREGQSNSRSGDGCEDGHGIPPTGEVQQGSKAQCKLGRATDGTRSGLDPTTNRVDRLRLLGNGVVPQVATKAFIELSRRLV